MGLGDREPLRQVGPNVIQNPQALPRAFVLPRAQAYTTARRPGMTPTQIVATNDVDFATQVLIEGDTGLSALPGPPTHRAQSAALESEAPNALRITATADVSSYLVVNDFYHRGWVAYVDGERTRVLIANALFRAVPIEAGQHSVEMRFEPVSHVVGAAMSLVGLVLTLALIGFGFTRRPAVFGLPFRRRR
jgi:hypothetical protein